MIFSLVRAENGDVRFVPGSNADGNVVQVFYNGIWGTICDQPPYTNYLYTAAEAACSILGYGSTKFYKTMYRPGHYYGPALLWNITCHRNATTFKECNSHGWYNVAPYCHEGHNQLFIQCYRKLAFKCYILR